MALFGEGGLYANNSGWYDILRGAQDGDRITAMPPDYQTSISGSFVRTSEGRIMIDMGYSHLVPEAEFARFGGRWAGWSPEYGMYHLQGVNGERWATVISGGQATLDSLSCQNVDCVAVTIDAVGIIGTGIQVASPACASFAPACAMGGAFVSRSAAVAGISWTIYSKWQGTASWIDLTVTGAGTIGGAATSDPRISLGFGIAQIIWDGVISPQ